MASGPSCPAGSLSHFLSPYEAGHSATQTPLLPTKTLGRGVIREGTLDTGFAHPARPHPHPHRTTRWRSSVSFAPQHLPPPLPNSLYYWSSVSRSSSRLVIFRVGLGCWAGRSDARRSSSGRCPAPAASGGVWRAATRCSQTAVVLGGDSSRPSFSLLLRRIHRRAPASRPSSMQTWAAA